MPVTASFTRDSDAYLSDGTLVRPNVPRFENGKFGQAIMVEEGTTNRLTTVDFESWVNYTDGESIGEMYFRQDELRGKVLRLKKTDTGTGRYGKKGFLSGMTGSVYNHSIYVRALSSTGRIACMYVDAQRSGGGLITSQKFFNLSDLPLGEWVRITTTHDGSPNTLSGGGSVFVWIDNAPGECEFALPQVELKSYATSFTPGTRDPEVLTIPTAEVLTDSGPWTVEFFCKKSFEFNRNHVLFSAWPKFYVSIGANSRALLSWFDGTQRTAYSSSSIPDVTGWHYWALSWDGTVAKVYVDAVKLIEVTTNLPSSLPSIAQIGRFDSNSVYSSLIDDLRISNRALTDEEIADAYVSNQPLPKDGYTTCKLSFDLTLRDKEGKYVVYDNTPQSGYIQWENLSIGYQGMMYDIADGYTNGTYVWWDFDKPYELQSSNTLPELTEDDVLVLLNKNGTHMTVPTASVVDGGLIVPESIMADAIAANAITGNKILAGSISSDKIAAGAVGAEAIAANAIAAQHIMAGAITSDHISANGIIGNKIIGGEILAGLVNIVGKDESGNSVVQIGHYEGLGPQTATFTRNSVAYKQDGTQVAADQPRYEYTALPYPVWQDTFDTNQLSQYTSGGDSPATWAVSGGVLTGTGGSQATLIKNDLLLQDCEIVLTSDQAQDGGIIARYQDNNNYYLLALYDDSGVAPTQNIRLYKRVGGTYTSLAYADVTWPRGTSKQIKFTLHGSRLEAYFDGVKVISVTDTTFTGGGVGLRHHGSTGSDRYLDFSVYYVQQGVMVEESTSNLVKTNAGATADFSDATGWSLNPNTSVSGGKLRLQSPDGSSVAIAQCVMTNVPANTAVSFSVRARYTDESDPGANGSLYVDFSGTGYDSNDQQLTIPSTQICTTFATFKRDGMNTGTPPSSFNFRIFSFSKRPIEVDFVQVELLPMATSFVNGIRYGEKLNVPTENVFNPGAWAMDMIYTPTCSWGMANTPHLWRIDLGYPDLANNYALYVMTDGRLQARLRSENVTYFITDSEVLVPGKTYHITITGDGSTFYLMKNGQLIGTSSYVPPAGTMPTEMCIGYFTGGHGQADGIIHDVRFSNILRTLAEHQAEYNSGLPLSVDDATTYLMSCDGHLQPSIRKFGIASKSGEIEGSIIRGSQIFGTRFQSGDEASSSYVQIGSGNSPIEVIRNNKPALNIWTSQNIGITGGTGGIVEFYDANDGSRKGYIAAYKDTGPYGLGDGLVISAEDNNTNHKDLILIGDRITLGVKNFGMFTRVYDYLEVDGDADIENLYVTGEKNAVQFTDNYGRRILSARESPDIRFEIEDIAQLENGECKVEIDPIFLECVVPHSDDYRWLVHATPYMSSMPGLYVAEIGDTYLVFRDLAGSNGQFFWRLSALRRGFENNWLEPYSDYNLDLLESNWEDEYMQLIEIEIDETVLTSGWEDELL
ncbi:LamG domain-containing protein [Desulfallas thermosapovorans]|uniref:Concanavalin A-like lectin/glucanase superfamily protein n=1 Tax=Desulfallas thermosapovorans DSM 6562 TaxID=1121431 RepID=A0A5S4ZSL2_9FIRM|nr:LamG domain-containing protein [Desulfallas thermosapovorans]TYO95124.1 concanavalin A-like lectin/glucanase superfamily protein [Desulfallas thermosapovorans DSM 6562]